MNKTGKSGGTRLVVAGALVLGVAAAGLGVWPRVQHGKELKAETQAALKQAKRVEFVTPHPASDGELTLPANIQADADTPLYARTSGYVVKLYAEIGQHVKAGELLAEIESAETDQQLQQSQADTRRAELTTTQSKSDVDRLRAGVAQAKATAARATAEVQQARSQVSGAKARLEQARANKAIAESKLTEAQQALEGQKSALKQSDAQLELATTTAKRIRGLLEEGFIAQQDDDQAQATLKSATAGNASAKASVSAATASVHSAQEAIKAADAAITTARADVQTSEEGLSAVQASEVAARANIDAQAASVRSGESFVQANRASVRSQAANQRRVATLTSYQQIRAPFPGVITARNVEVGTLVNAGGATGTTAPTANGAKAGLFGLARTNVLRIQVSVPQALLSAVALGTKTKISVAELPGRTFQGTVIRQSGALDSTSRTRLTELRLSNEKGELLPGMFAQIAFETAKRDATLRVPASVLDIGAQGTRVAVIHPDNTVHFVDVKLGRDFGSEAEVLGGLKGDEKLVTNPTSELHDGMKVQATEAAPPKAP